VGSIPPDLANSALDAAPAAMIIVDGQGSVVFANTQASSIFGYARDDIVGRPVEQLLPGWYGGARAGHLFARRRDGSMFPAEIDSSPLQSGGEVLVSAAIRDITLAKRAEAELIAARKSAERSQDLAIEARISADRANQAKSRFLATASHDLRQPLQALALLNRTLRTLATSADATDALAQQEQTIAAMSRLLNTLLDISKLESGGIQPSLSDFPVAEMFRELKREFSAVAADKGLELQLEDGDLCLHSDPSLVEEILRNLTANAVKYTQRGSVRLRCVRDATSILIQVIDTGIGIPDDQIRYIFDEFYQVGVRANGSREGYGLGLSIVKRIVDLLHLVLDVQSAPGQGSTFSIRLPIGCAENMVTVARRSPSRARAVPIRKPRILLVEDEAAVRQATRLLLTVEGYEVHDVTTLGDAMQAVKDGGEVDLLITDYHLRHGVTGLQVIGALRELTGGVLKALLMTGDTSAVIRKLPQEPYLRVLSKPVDADELLSAIESLLASHG
jgi:two-component system, sensor histidine kinase